MPTLADLKAEDHHIRIGEAFVQNQKRIVSDRAARGEPTERDEHWLAVFVAGLSRHRRRRDQIVAELSAQARAAAAGGVAEDDGPSSPAFGALALRGGARPEGRAAA